MCNTNDRDIQECRKYTEDPGPPASLEFLEAVKQLLMESHRTLALPLTVTEALDLYVDITTFFDQL